MPERAIVVLLGILNVIAFNNCLNSVFPFIIEMCGETGCDCYALKSIGVKFKVVVTDEDIQYDDDVDGFVQLLLLTPALNASMAKWTNITMLGTRSVDKTR